VAYQQNLSSGKVSYPHRKAPKQPVNANQALFKCVWASSSVRIWRILVSFTDKGAGAETFGFFTDRFSILKKSKNKVILLNYLSEEI
jgi:hypothetical protein